MSEQLTTLGPRGRITITISEQREPSRLFQPRKGLWVHPGFEVVVSRARPIAAGTRVALDIFEVVEPEGMTDAENESALPENHRVGETVACAVIAETVVKQSSGEEGGLPTNRLILLYLQPCVVGFGWDSGYADWGVGAWDRGAHKWWGIGAAFSHLSTSADAPMV